MLFRRFQSMQHSRPGYLQQMEYSCLCCLIWYLCEAYIVKALQVLQNRAARQVTKLSWFTASRRLLNQCNWLSIRQLIFYHSALTVFRTTRTKTPLYLSQHLITEHPYPTRLALGGLRVDGIHGGLVNKSFLIRAAKDFNTIPADIRMCRTIPALKQQFKKRIKLYIPLD